MSGRVVPLLLVDRVQQVKGVGQHVPRPGRRVAQPDLLGGSQAQEVGLRLQRRDVVLHPLRQPRARPVQQPQPAQRVLHQVAHDPVRREQLRGGRDVLGRDLAVVLQRRKDLVLLLGDVELVQPADHLHVLARLRRQRIAHVLQDRVRREQVVGHAAARCNRRSART